MDIYWECPDCGAAIEIISPNEASQATLAKFKASHEEQHGETYA